jgi:hypothetical protein
MVGNQSVTKEYIEYRIDNWEQRIKELFSKIADWARERPDVEFHQASQKQRNEYLMRESNIQPRDFPKLFFKKGDRRVVFAPSALWVVGANGRIDVIANDNLYIIVDLEDDLEKERRWRITFPNDNLIRKEFNKEAFLEIIDEVFGNESSGSN